MELVLEKNLDFLLRPRDDMWWLRKERLLVVKMQDSTARERERGGRESVVKSETEPTPRHPDEGGKKKKKNPKQKKSPR